MLKVLITQKSFTSRNENVFSCVIIPRLWVLIEKKYL